MKVKIMIFEFANYKLDVNVEETRKYYKTAKLISEGCSCRGCMNYEKAIDFLPQKVVSFFAQLGVDMKKAREIYANCPNADNTLLYGGWYHVCATMIQGESAWIPTGQGNGYYLDETKAFFVTDNFKVFFQEECDLIDKHFPLPAIQLEIDANIPWVFSQKQDYF